jgi:hypothetical protein
MSNLLEQASLVLIPSGYKEDVVYSQIPTDGSGDLSFTRASNGTRVNSAGLVEDCPWNLAEQSNAFNTSPWVSNNSSGTNPVITANYGIAPDGTLTAQRIQLARTNTTTSYSQIYQYPVAVVIGQTYTWSVYLKSLSGTPTISIIGDFGRPPVTLTSEWVRYTGTATATASPTQLEIAILGSNYATGNSLSADFLAYGYQLNIGSTAKPYFPTTDRLDVPRLTYQNGGGGCPSLLLEKQSTNYITYSEQFDNAAWTKNGVSITANDTTSPDGTQNADKLTSNDPSGSVYRIYEANAIPSDSVCSVSVYFKYDNWQYAFIVGDNYSGAGKFVVFDLINGTNTFVSSGYTATISSVGSGWYKCTMTGEMGITAYCQFGLAPTSTAYNSISIANGKNLYVWGTQREVSSYPTSYIPTTSSTATRVADVANKSSISSLFGASATSFFMDFEITQVSSDATWTVTGYDGSNLFSLCQFGAITNFPRIVFDGGVDTTLGTALSIGRHKIAVSFATNDFRAYIDGALVLTDTSCTYNRYDRIAVNGTAWTGNTNNNNSFKLNEYAQFPNVLTNAELASLTTI